MYEIIAHFQQLDPRHLYAQGSNNMHWAPSYAEGDDFWVAKGIADDRGNPSHQITTRNWSNRW